MGNHLPHSHSVVRRLTQVDGLAAPYRLQFGDPTGENFDSKGDAILPCTQFQGYVYTVTKHWYLVACK